MTLDNCIKRYEIWASDDRISPNIREEHKQIVEWLTNYKKMLEQEPCEDAVSREYILSKAHCCCNDLADDELCCVDVDDIKEAPSIQPKPIECEDCISREEAINAISHAEVSFQVESELNFENYKREVQEIVDGILKGQVKALSDLPSVLPKPKTDVLDKIRTEIHATAEMHEDGDYYLRDEWIDEIIDKYKAESEE